MNRLIIPTEGPNEDGLAYGIKWLASLGGGVLIAPLKSTIRGAFDIETDGEYRRFSEKLANIGISISIDRGSLILTGRKPAFAMYPTKEIIDRVEKEARATDFLVLGWHRDDFQRWVNEHQPTIVSDATSSIENVVSMRPR